MAGSDSETAAAQPAEVLACPEKLASFLELLHGPTTTTVALAQNVPDGKFTQSTVHAEQLGCSAAALLGKPQCYIGLHPLYPEAKGRKADDVAVLNGYFVDLDLYRIQPSDDRKLAEQLLGCRHGSPEMAATIVRQFLRDQGIPEPNLVIFSGRGIQVFWLSTPQPLSRKAGDRDRAIGKWALVQGRLAELLLPFGADKQALDLTQIVRMPETINAKSGEKARVLYSAPGRLDPRAFDHLVDHAALRTMNQAVSKRRSRRASLALPERMRVVRRTREEIIDFLAWRYPDGLGEGCALRHSVVHTIARTYRFSSRPDQWETDAFDWATGNTDLPEPEICSILKSLQKNPGGFSPKVAARVLGVTKEIADERGYLRLRPERLSDEQRRARNTELRRLRRREAGSQERLSSVVDEIAAAAGVSRSTLYRRTSPEQRSQASALWRGGDFNEALRLLDFSQERQCGHGETSTSFPIRRRREGEIHKEGHTSVIRTDRLPPLHEFLGMSERSLRRRPSELREEAARIYMETGDLPRHLLEVLGPKKPGRRSSSMPRSDATPRNASDARKSSNGRGREALAKGGIPAHSQEENPQNVTQDSDRLTPSRVQEVRPHELSMQARPSARSLCLQALA